MPGSGWFPAIALFIVGVGLVDRDGVVAVLGLAFGAFAVLLTVVIVLSLAGGAEAMMG
ncbi:exopolysaccharide biosynthesis protein [Rhodovulum sp.]|uniref:exopolysaccharide biosynthesis protein n=1 Tax=Rhodovulum sp. TaxID=34009 RepID=UPI0032E39721